MSNSKHEINLINRKERIEQQLEYYLNQNCYDINIADFIRDLDEALLQLYYYVWRKDLTPALMLGGHYYFLCQKVLYANKPLTLKADSLTSIIIFSIMVARLYMCDYELDIAHTIYRKALALDLKRELLEKKDQDIDNKKKETLETVRKLFQSYIGMSTVTLTKNNKPIKALTNKKDTSWHEHYFSLLPETKDKNEIKRPPYDYNAKLASLFSEILDKDIAYLFAKNVLPQQPLNQDDLSEQQLTQAILIESIHLSGAVNSKNQETCSKRVGVLKAYLDRYEQQENHAEDILFILHQAQLALVLFYLETGEIEQAVSCYRQALHALKSINDSASDTQKKLIATIYQLESASNFFKNEKQERIQTVLHKIISTTLDSIREDALIHSDIRVAFDAALLFINHYLTIETLLAHDRSSSINEHLLTRTIKARHNLDDSLFGCIHYAVEKKIRLIEINPNELFALIERQLKQIKVLEEENNNNTKLTAAYATIMQYISMIDKVIINQVYTTDLDTANCIKLIILCETLADKFSLAKINNHQVQFLSYACVFSKYLSLSTTPQKLNQDVLGRMSSIHFKLANYYRVNQDLERAKSLTTQAEQYENYFNNKLDDTESLSNNEITFIVRFIQFHYQLAQNYDEANSFKQVIRHYERIVRYSLLEDLAHATTWKEDVKITINSAREFFKNHRELPLSSLLIDRMALNSSNEAKSESPVINSFDSKVSPQLRQLFRAIESRNKIVITLSTQIDLNTKHPIIGITPLCHAALSGNIMAFTLFLRSHQPNYDEQCNILYWTSRCPDENIRKLIFEHIYAHRTQLPELSEKNIAAALGNSAYFKIHQFDDECAYYATLANQVELLNTYGSYNAVPQIDMQHTTLDDLIAVFIKQARLSNNLDYSSNQKTVDQLIAFLVVAKEFIENQFQSSSLPIPPHLLKIFIELEYTLSSVFHIKEDIDNHAKHYQRMMGYINQLQNSAKLDDLLSTWILDIFFYISYQGLLFANEYNLYECQQLYSLSLVYFKQISLKIVGTAFTNPLRNSFLQFLKLTEMISKQFDHTMSLHLISPGYEIIKMTTNLVNITDETVIKQLGYALTWAWYRKANLLMLEKNSQDASVSSAIFEAIGNATDIETSILNLYKANDAHNVTLNGWFYSMLLTHYKSYLFLKTHHPKMSMVELNQTNKYLKLIVNSSIKLPLKLHQFHQLLQAANTCLVTTAIYDPSPGNLNFFEKCGQFLSMLQYDTSLNLSVETSLPIINKSSILRNLSINYCRVKNHDDSAKNNNYDGPIIEECTKALNKLNELITDDELQNYSTEEKIIICDRLFWFSKLPANAEQSLLWSNKAISLTKQLIEVSKETSLSKNLSSLIIKLTLHAFETLRNNLSNKKLSSNDLNIMKYLIDYAYKNLIDLDTLEIGHCQFIIKLIIGYTEILNEYQPSECLIYYQKCDTLFTKLLKQFSINDLTLSVIGEFHFNCLAMFSFSSSKDLSIYIKAQASEMIALIRMCEMDEFDNNELTYCSNLLEIDCVTAAHFNEQGDKTLSFDLLQDAIATIELLNITRNFELFASDMKAPIAPFIQIIQLSIDLGLTDQAIDYYNRALQVSYTLLNILNSIRHELAKDDKTEEQLITSLKMIGNLMSQKISNKNAMHLQPQKFLACLNQLSANKSASTKTRPNNKGLNSVLDLFTEILVSKSSEKTNPPPFELSNGLSQTRLSLSLLVHLKQDMIKLINSRSKHDFIIDKLLFYKNSLFHLIKYNCLEASDLIKTLQHFLDKHINEFQGFTSNRVKSNLFIRCVFILIDYYLSIVKLKDSTTEVTSYEMLATLLNRFYEAHKSQGIFEHLEKSQISILKSTLQTLKDNSKQILSFSEMEQALVKDNPITKPIINVPEVKKVDLPPQICATPQIKMSKKKHRNRKQPVANPPNAPVTSEPETSLIKPVETKYYPVEIDEDFISHKSNKSKPKNTKDEVKAAVEKPAENQTPQLSTNDPVIDSTNAKVIINNTFTLPEATLNDLTHIIIYCFDGSPQRLFAQNIDKHCHNQKTAYPYCLKPAADELLQFTKNILNSLRLTDSSSKIVVDNSIQQFIREFNFGNSATSSPSNSRNNYSLGASKSLEEIKSQVLLAASYLHQAQSDIDAKALEILNKYDYSFTTLPHGTPRKAASFDALLSLIATTVSEFETQREAFLKQKNLYRSPNHSTSQTVFFQSLQNGYNPHPSSNTNAPKR